MSVSNPPESSAGLIARVKGILLKPKEEWGKIEGESATIQGIYTSYVAILVALPIVCRLIGSLVFGYSFLGVTYHPPLVGSVVSAVVQYVLQLVGIFVLALIIDALAPTFGGQKNRLRAFKLAAYCGTAAWVAGCFGLIPMIAVLSLLGLYSLYLLYIGIPVMMKVPAEKALVYEGAIIVAIIVVGLVFGLVVSVVAPRPSHVSADGAISGQLKLPGGGSVDLKALRQAANGVAAAARQTEATSSASAGSAGTPSSSASDAAGDAAGPGSPPITPDALKAALPGGLPGGFTAGDVSTGSGGVAGLSGSVAKATYSKGDSDITLSVTDLGALGAMASLAGAVGAHATEQNGASYSKMSTVNGRMTKEEYDGDNKSGSYSILVSNRVMVEAEGSNVSMDDLKSALGSIDLNHIESLAK
jgi:Yip1 domain